jgi:hypothetical protein
MANPTPTATSFAPGRSGNPAGRPADKEIAALARRYTPDVIRTLVDVCRNARENPSARVAAANALADRGWGKPRQEVDLGGGLGQALHLHLYAVQRLETARAVAADLEAPPIEGEAEDYADLLREALPPLPHEALPLWDAAPATSEGGGDAAKPAD